mgnify:CR=1 FL=1
MSEKILQPIITDNFIDPVLFSDIKHTLTGDTFFWFYNDYVNYRPCDGYKFTNEIIKDSNLTHRSFINYFHMIKPALDKINPKKLHSVRFNLFLKTIKPEKYLINSHEQNSKLAIFLLIILMVVSRLITLLLKVQKISWYLLTLMWNTK